MVKKVILWVVVVLFFMVSIFGAGYITARVGFTRQLDRELVTGRARIDQLTNERDKIAGVSDSLRIRFDSIQGGLRTAKGLIDDISIQGRNAQETLRIVIDNLRKVKTIIQSSLDP